VVILVPHPKWSARVSTNRTPRELWRQSIDWLGESGWPTRREDAAIADKVYRKWLAATNQEWLSTHYRDRDELADALDRAFRPIRDERTADSLVVVELLLLEIRGRREGTLRRGRNH
jgi:hypothetical protein